jgi:two-component system sensor histidine kinase LytS
MLHLLMDMLERVGFLIATAFVFSRSKWMRSYMRYNGDKRYHWRFLLFFTFYAILGTYSGVAVSGESYLPAPWVGNIPHDAAIANSRTLGVVIAGLLGGVRSGFVVGLAAGIHRYTLGGFVAVACMIAPIVQGVVAGMCRSAIKRRFRNVSSVRIAFAVGFVAEALQMGLILLLARPWHDALTLVWQIGVPQTIASSIGVALFFMLHNTMENEEDRIATTHEHKALQIADRTMPYWKSPLDKAVAGIGQIFVEETKAVGAFFYKDGEERAAAGKKTAHSIDVPIETETKRTIGVFRLFYVREQDVHPSRQLMMRSLSQLLSQQYAFFEAERQAQLAADAEIRALQAQMSPHFLFNVLNTVKSFIRTKPEEARHLITQLGKFMRHNMRNTNRTMSTIRDELELVTAYLELSKARLGDRLVIVAEIDSDALECPLPPFTIQPLVENAVVHGIKSLDYQGVIRLVVQQEREAGLVKIAVEDNGAGISRNWTAQKDGEEHAGLALANIENRLRYHYGGDKALHIASAPGEGTQITFWVRRERHGMESGHSG